MMTVRDPAWLDPDYLFPWESNLSPDSFYLENKEIAEEYERWMDDEETLSNLAYIHGISVADMEYIYNNFKEED